MHWKYPLWLWAQIFPLFVLAAAIAAYAIQRRRLLRFGDRRVLRVPRRISWQLLRALLFVLGGACAAAVLAEPDWYARGVPSSTPSLDIILDLTSGAQPAGQADPGWETFYDSVDSLCAAAPGSRMSLYGLGYAEGLEVPQTSDVEGLLLVLNGFLPRKEKPTAVEASAELAARLVRQAGADSLRVVMISSRTREDLQKFWVSIPKSASTPLLLRIPVEGGAPEFGLPAGSAGWIWSGQTATLRSFLAGRSVRDRSWPAPWNRLSAVQAVALAGFLLLLGEIAGPLIVRSWIGGKSVD